METEKFNLFVYGSLRDPQIFKSVCGLSFTLNPMHTGGEKLFAELALLNGYRRVSPDNVYFYAVADPAGRIEGYVILDIPQKVMSEIDRYEGKRYTRETVKVNTAAGLIEAQAYLVSVESMKKRFGDRFHVNLIHELWLRKRIEKFIEKHTRPGEYSPDADIERRAERELLAVTERDLVVSHYRSDAISDYSLERELKKPRPSIKPLYKEQQARPFIENYLAIVVKQVLLNQLDEKIQANYRFELEHIRSSERYFKRSVSLLIALRMINHNSSAVNMIVDRCLKSIPYLKYDLIDYVKYAVIASESLYDARVVRSEIERARTSIQPGLVPLGAELELSNLGFKTAWREGITQEEADNTFDGFRYFHDFNLDVLSWKLGGYIDDHSGDTDRARRCGFLELAPGRLSTVGELSRPASAGPWLMNQLIHEIIAFYPVKPHSLHLSFQLRRKQIGRQGTLPLDFAMCLLALGGGLQPREDGGFVISRMTNDEIIRYDYGEELLFARTSKRQWFVGDSEVGEKTPVQAVTWIQQYKFIRLDRQSNYEPLIMALKGIQLAVNPGEYLTAAQLESEPKLREEYEQLKKWSLNPQPISQDIIRKFTETIHQGLMTERIRKPAHRLHYIDWAVSSIEVQLQLFNEKLRQGLM